MKFSTRTTYGLRAMIRLAENRGKGSLALSIIAKDEKISQKYLERLFVELKKAKLVKAVIGAGGGYELTRDPSKIEIYEIVKSLEGKMSPFHCLTEDGKIYCGNECNCGATSVLIKVQQAINNTLKNIKLKDLMQ